MVKTALSCLSQGLNAFIHCLFHQFFRHRRVLGALSSIFLLPWSLGYPVGIGSCAILPSMAPNSRRVRWFSANSSQ